MCCGHQRKREVQAKVEFERKFRDEGKKLRAIKVRNATQADSYNSCGRLEVLQRIHY